MVTGRGKRLNWNPIGWLGEKRVFWDVEMQIVGPWKDVYLYRNYLHESYMYLL